MSLNFTKRFRTWALGMLVIAFATPGIGGTVFAETRPSCGPVPSVNLSTASPSCVSGSEGQITASLIGAPPLTAYEYRLAGAATRPYQSSPTFTGLGAGTYTVFVREVGCTAEGSATTTLNSVAPATIINASGQTTSAATLFWNAAGGSVGSYTLRYRVPGSTQWLTISGLSASSNSRTLSGLQAGTTYEAQIASVCSVGGLISPFSASFNFSTLPQVATCLTPASVYVSNEAYTSARVNWAPVTGATCYLVSWGLAGSSTSTWPEQPAGLSTFYDITGLTPGAAYRVRVRAVCGSGCTGIVRSAFSPLIPIQTFSCPSSLTINGGQTSVVGCGSAELSVTNVNSPSSFTFDWQFNSGSGFVSQPGLGTSNTITVTQSGTYRVNVTINGCPSTISSSNINVTIAGNFAVNALGTNVACFGATTGTATANLIGGQAPFAFGWSNGGNTQTITNLPAGTYTVTVADFNNCTRVSAVTITQPSTPFTASVTVNSHVPCFGAASGSLTAVPNGGVVPYTYLWSNGATTATASGLLAGVHTVTVFGADGCQAVASNVLTQPAAPLTVSFSDVSVTCIGGSNGSATVVPAGGTPGYTILWTPGGQTTPTISNLSAGIYTASVTDANGCGAWGSVNVTQPAEGINITITSQTNVACHGGNNGAINLNVTGTQGTASYLWNNGSTSLNRSGLSAGIYTLTVTDASSCTRSFVATITQPDVLGVILTPVAVNCHGTSTGSISSLVSGGTMGFAYSWSNGATTVSIMNLSAGSYSLTVTDANGCVTNASATVNQPTPVTASITATNATCFQVANGSATVLTGGGTGTITRLWSTGSTATTITGLLAATYTVTATDANNCTSTASVTITQPPTNPVNVTTIITHVSCFGGSNGSVVANVTGQTNPVTYAWSVAGTTNTITGLAANTYTVTVTDANGCTRSAVSMVTQPAVFGVMLSKNDVTCPGGSNGSINTNVNGGTAPFSYLWSTTSTNANLAGLAAGTYTVTVTDSKGCTSFASTTLTMPTTLSAGLVVTPVKCRGDVNGTATASPTGGTAPYTYLWNNGATTAAINNLSPGAYAITVTDVRGCTVQSSGTVTEPATLFTIAVTTTQPSVCGNGGAAVTPNNGVTPYAFIWSNGMTTATVTGLMAGTYTVTATDGNGCSRVSTQILTAPSAIVAVATTKNNVLCHGQSNGNVTMTVTGGRPPYGYAWNIGGGVNTANTTTQTGLAANLYTLTVTDADGCQHISNIVITQPGVLAITPTVVHPACTGAANGSITLNVMGGTPIYNYLWSTNASGNPLMGQTTVQNIINLTAGTYTVTIIDNNGCSINQAINVIDPTNALIITGFSGHDVTCFGANNGTLTVNTVGGIAPLTYNWTNGATTQTISNLSGIAGTTGKLYTVTVTDARGCTRVATEDITQPWAPMSIASVQISNATCEGRTDASAQVMMPLNPMNISAAAACTGAQVPNTLRNYVGTPFCVFPYYMFAWSNGNNQHTLTNVPAGTYTVTVTDNAINGGCSITTTVVIGTVTRVSMAVASKTDVACRGAATGAINITTSNGTPAYSYNWSNGSTQKDQTGLMAGTYTVTVSDFHACTNTLVVTITQPASGVGVTLAATSPRCAPNDGFINSNVTGGTAPYNYNWGSSILTPNRTNLTGGTYTLTVTDASGCSTTAQATLMNGPTAGLAAPNWAPRSASLEVTCFGRTDGDVAMSTNMITGGTPFMGNTLNYAWSNGVSGQFTAGQMLPARSDVFAAGTFTVTITDANGCTVTGTQVVTQPAAALMVTAPSITHVACRGAFTGQINISVTGGTASYTYRWASPSGVAAANALPLQTPAASGVVNNPMGLGAGTYTVTITDTRGCTASVSATITQPATTLTITPTPTHPRCAPNDGSIMINVTGGTPGYTYDWGGGNFMQNRTMLAGGTYTVTVTDAAGCSNTATVVLNNGPMASLVAPTWAARTPALEVKCRNGNDGDVAASSNNITGGTTFPPNNYLFHWSNGQNGSFTAGTPLPALNNVFVAGTFTVTITDANGCTVTGMQVVTQPATNVTASFSFTTNIICAGTSTGALTVQGMGGTLPYTYAWSHNTMVTTNVASGLSAGTYTATVTDANGCVSVVSTTVTQSATPALSATATVTANSCSSGSTLVLNVTGGTSPMTFNWNDIGLASTTRTNLNPSGMPITYTVTITDNNGCTFVLPTTVPGNNTSALSLYGFAARTNISCKGGMNGTIGVAPNHPTCNNYPLSITGGTPFTGNLYMYLWSNGMSGTTIFTTNCGNVAYVPQLTGLAQGNYTVTVTDSKGCTATQTFTLTEPALPLSASIVSTANPTCGNAPGNDNGFINTSVTGGTTPYSYAWSTGTHFTQNITGLTGGTYTLTVTDANGCSRSVVAALTAPPALNPGSLTITNVVCAGTSTGSATLSLTSGGTPPYTISWTAQAPHSIGTQIGATATGLNVPTGTSQNYIVLVTDVNGCTAQLTATITQPAAPIAINPNFCVTPNSAHLSCGAAFSRHVSCFGGNTGRAVANVTGATGNIAYVWSTGALYTGPLTTQTLNNLVAGNYTLTATDANGCSAVQVYEITQPLAVLGVVTNAFNPTCAANALNTSDNGSVTTNVTGGVAPYAYAWAAFSDATLTTAYAAGNTALASMVNAGMPNVTMLPALTTGSWYVVTVTDANGCTTTSVRQITRPADFVLNPTVKHNNCYDAQEGEILFSPVNAIKGGTTPYTYVWNEAANFATSADIVNLFADTYTVTITDANSCTITHEVTLTQPNPLMLQISYPTTSNTLLCFDATDEIVFTMGFDDDADPFTHPIVADPTVTTYFIDVLKDGISQGTIIQPADGPWNPAPLYVTVPNLGVGDYAFVVTTDKGCTQVLSQSLTSLSDKIEILNGAMGITHVTGCENGTNGSIDILVFGGSNQSYQIEWSNGLKFGDILDPMTDPGLPASSSSSAVPPVTFPTPPTMLNDNLSAGTYTVTVTDITSLCTATRSFTVLQSPFTPFSIASIMPGTTSATFNMNAGVSTQFQGYEVEIRPTIPSNGRWERFMQETEADGTAPLTFNSNTANTGPGTFWGDGVFAPYYFLGNTQLNPGTTYQSRIRTICGNVPGSWITGPNFTTTAGALECGYVSNIRATSVGATTAALRWDGPYTGTPAQSTRPGISYVVGIRPSGNPNAPFTLRPCVSSNFIALGGLARGTTYDVYVQTRCAANANPGAGTCSSAAGDLLLSPGTGTPNGKVNYMVFTTLSTRDAADLSQTNVATPAFSDISVYPNPAKGSFTVNFTAQNDDVVSLKLTDLLGKPVLNRMVEVSAGDNSIPVKVEGYASGVYLLQVMSGETSRTVKVILN